jgi:AraC family transcriptional activator of pobA
VGFLWPDLFMEHLQEHRKFEHSLNDYFNSQKLQGQGTPTVGFFANEPHLSANNFGDLVKKETGKTE